ncbi:hypothetical protein Ae168Ps1_2737 [Pseudonocardia sp. Ae168_Ps1]|uniref:SsgA family sporulation/cell division regulator n=1 Tax=unclassified Pseudonocardia TaxID=2619320 RepID=UPI00094AF8EB|nr:MULTISPECIES: SsgA family sporulation/cell division regulator [unclassified Pseudonocardia]OLL74351.1 hypothetical protein Ae150APs1_2729 [Pseudonocardia sp. Ae150A_Ps1]OLL80331.1 hypothetical protein Ae168Ps1_2737 [Pseudonocardia sp. Ae168_Ps1]OLL85542.1 hypothetical protein Ae263Ps1_2597c [Pseudonocardia sp. Ae263_Ps1]OLL94431.1 hypothetical protein Ae356Ps1_4328 [Pseudonocardia sp. Ae356_Ps1]
MADTDLARRCTETLLLRIVRPLSMRVWTVARFEPHTDPWSVKLHAAGGLSTGPTTPLAPGCYWTISRDLLAAGLIERVGCREHIQIEPAGAGESVRITHGSTVAYTRAAPLTAFLGRAYSLVGAGAESAWVDADRQAAALPAA